MRRRLVASMLSVALLVPGAALAASAVPPSPTAPAPAAITSWQPDVRAALAYIRHRRGIISFSIRTETRSWGYHPTRTFPSASIFKALLLVGYLDDPSVRGRALNAHDRSWLDPMIRRSDDTAAQHVFDFLGRDRLRALGRRVGMRRLVVAAIWGRSRVDAEDESRFFLHIDQFVTPRHRALAMTLLASIIPPQRWGIARVRVPGWRLYFKSGWGAGTGWVDHQVALLVRGPMRVAVAILTHFDGSHPYGEQSLQGIAARLLHGLGEGSWVG